MLQLKNILLGAVSILFFSACEDVIDLELDNGKTQLVVDAFLNSDRTVQTVRLTTSAPYFSNVATPAANDASVRLIGPGSVIFNFVSDGDGNYQYNPLSQGAIDSLGFNYRLEIDYNGDTYVATSILNPSPLIDSISYIYEDPGFPAEEGFYARFYARDLAGRKDYYWIKPFRNDTAVYSDPAFIILAEDATPGGDSGDGLVFIDLYREIITDIENPFEFQDTVRVEIHSLNLDAYNFLDQVVNTSRNDGLFAVPPSNIRSNIVDAAGNAQDEVLGLFSLSSISKFEVIIE